MLWLAATGVLLAITHVFAWGRGLLLLVMLLALDLCWAAALALWISEWRDQRRLGLTRVEIDGSSARLGGSIALRVCNDRGFAGLRGLTVWLSCIDAVRELREATVAQDGQRGEEEQQVCYVIWADERRASGPDLAARTEIAFTFAVPTLEELGAPVERLAARSWEVEVQRLGATSLCFEVSVADPER